MAGGLYKDRPFQYNTKCVVFGSALAISYFVLPCPCKLTQTQKVAAGSSIMILAYVGMAQYDAYYDCQNQRLKHRKGLFNDITGPFKPPPQWRKGHLTY